MAASLRSLGAVARIRGEYERAAALLGESLALSRDIGAKDLLAEGLSVLAWVEAARGQAARGARLGGAARAVREALGVALPPYQQADQERAVQDMRAALGETAFAAAWAEGRALPLEEAVALALGDTGTVLQGQ
jgi:hypothetical protein